MGVLTRFLEPNNLRPLFDVASITGDVVRALREDAGFLSRARRALLPLPIDRAPPLDHEPFGDLEALDVPALKGKRVALVASGGSGATACTLGVLRAFEEAQIEPVAISASSGSVLFCLPWACGLSAATIGRFWLELPQSGYLDPDWWALVRSSRRAFGGWAGLLRGAAIERSGRVLLGDRRLEDTRLPFSTVAWNVDLNRTETFGTRTTPALEAALALRLAISLPIFVEPLRIGEHLYGDGGIVDIFPLRPVLEDRPDVIVGVNCYLPEGFAGEDLTGWHQRSFSVLRVSGQLRWSGMVELARAQARLADQRLVLLHPVPYSDVRGARFYESFADRSRWTHFMRAGRVAAREMLARWRPPVAADRDARQPEGYTPAGSYPALATGDHRDYP